MYRDGVTFEDIVMLYHYDEALRRMFLRYLLMIERSIKAALPTFFVMHTVILSQNTLIRAIISAHRQSKPESIA